MSIHRYFVPNAQMYSEVPAIDFSRFLAVSASDRQEVISEIDNALGSVGFVYHLNHGIDQDKIDTFRMGKLCVTCGIPIETNDET
jgi:hypothetical protein